MARKAKESTEAPKLSPEDFQKFVKEAVRQKQSISEYVSSAGGHIKNQIERLGLNPKAAKQAVKLHAMEEAQRQAFWRDALTYSFYLGHFDPIDMFDDFGKVLTQILERIEGSEKQQRMPDPAVTQFN